MEGKQEKWGGGVEVATTEGLVEGKWSIGCMKEREEKKRKRAVEK